MSSGYQNTLPATSAYQSYGAAKPQGGWASAVHKSDAYLEDQGGAVEHLVKPAKIKKTGGFLGFSRVDVFAMITIVLLPLLIFAAVYALVGFWFRYAYSTIVWALVLVIFAGVVYTGYVAVSRMLQQADGINDHLAVWAAAIFIGVNLAFFSGLVFGMRNYGHNMEPYYQRMELHSYTDIDPSSMDGKAFMDAGSMTFKAGSHLDVTKSTGFLNLNMYCVAPIVSPGAAPATHDFWAVGLNCCTGASQNFACGSHLQTDVSTGGLRLISGSELPFYKLAVTQATSNYGLKSAHPLFFHWVQNPDADLTEFRNRGLNSFLPALSMFAVVVLFLLIGAIMVVVIVKSRYEGKAIWVSKPDHVHYDSLTPAAPAPKQPTMPSLPRMTPPMPPPRSVMVPAVIPARVAAPVTMAIAPPAIAPPVMRARMEFDVDDDGRPDYSTLEFIEGVGGPGAEPVSSAEFAAMAALAEGNAFTT